MQNVSDTYKALAAAEAPLESRLIIDGVTYGPEVIEDGTPTIEQRLYGDGGPAVGQCVSAQFLARLIGVGENAVSKTAEIKHIYRRSDGLNTSEWIPGGTYYVSENDYDEVSDVLTLRGYDAMIKLDQYFVLVIVSMYQRTGKIDLSAPAVMAEMARFIGVEIDSRTELDPNIEVQLPSGWDVSDGIDDEEAEQLTELFNLTCRTVAGYIAALHGGNWTITPEGKLRLVPFIPEGDVVYTVLGDEDGNVLEFPGGFALSLYETPETAGDAAVHNLQRSMDAFRAGKVYAPWSGVKFISGDKTLAEAGDESGQVLKIDCPWGTEESAYSILGKISGHIYRPGTASGTLLDPAAELGDMAICDGTETVVASRTIKFSGLPRSELAAPAEDQTEDKYPQRLSVSPNIQQAIDQAAQATKADVLKTVGSTGRTVALDLSHIVGDGKTASGWFTEKIEGDETVYTFDVSTKQGLSGWIITCPDGKTVDVTLKPGTI